MVQYLGTTLATKVVPNAYTNNPNLPKIRGEAVALVRKGWSVRKVARYLGFTHSAVVKWVARTKVWLEPPP